MFDIDRSGCHFTWTQKPKNGVGVLKKIDRVMGNNSFVSEFPNSVALFHPYRLSDHCPCLLDIPTPGKPKPRSFKFANFLVFKPGFQERVKRIWDTHVDGVPQFQVVKKLKLLKSPIRELLFQQGNLHKKVETIRRDLDSIQLEIDSNPMNADLWKQEAKLSADLQVACLDEERFLKQKSKVEWLCAGDANTKFFHASLKTRNHMTRIEAISNSQGVLFQGEEVPKVLVHHYENFLGLEDNITRQPTYDLFDKKFRNEDANHMARPVTSEEVKLAMFSIGNDKAPGPNGYTAAFYKHAWQIIGPDVSKAIMDFFGSAYSVELMHNYHRNIGPPRCAFKVDIQKAYDTVDWSFLKHVLSGFGVHSKMIHWIMMCVSTPTYSICVNGETHGYFKGKRGLRQGDPLSPYLFTLVMEILTCILHRATQLDSSFRFHNKCEKQKIINLCFADDLFLFARGDVRSAQCIMDSLSRFSNMSGLVPSIQKSTAFFCNVSSHVKEAILDILPFEEGMLPVKYLGVPLISTRLRVKDCSVLLERLDQRIMNWKNKLLSFAGRLQLILSVLSSLHVYWASAFILPVRVVNELEAKMRNFLWAQEGSFHRGKAKVSWKAICVPKYEGGLEIRRVGDVNKALMVSHIWSILKQRDSLWVQWIHSYRLRDRNFWNCKETTNCGWSWRKILQLRPLVKEHIWSSLGAGTTISAWYDSWCHLGPLSNILSPRIITNAGFRLDAMVADVYRGDSWAWPVSWRDLFPVLTQLDHIRPDHNKRDRLLWKDGDNLMDHSSSTVWDSLRIREQEVNWVSIVWFPQCIPRHAFLVWLIMRRKLLTQDKILKWDLARRKNMNMMCCLLCYADVDSHDHLFFECKFSTQVWNPVRAKADMVDVDPKWSSIVSWLMTRRRSKTASSYVARLLVGATAYIIWQERNARLFKNQTRPPEAISEVILKIVRYKLMGVKFKSCATVKSFLGKRGIGEDAMEGNGG
ncbi:putative RNA-directed DNA polymerase [Helianthus annuus]|nr:putative RNA-directed DNA polymerase [Helianthus annuus]